MTFFSVLFEGHRIFNLHTDIICLLASSGCSACSSHHKLPRKNMRVWKCTNAGHYVFPLEKECQHICVPGAWTTGYTVCRQPESCGNVEKVTIIYKQPCLAKFLESLVYNQLKSFLLGSAGPRLLGALSSRFISLTPLVGPALSISCTESLSVWFQS